MWLVHRKICTFYSTYICTCLFLLSADMLYVFSVIFHQYLKHLYNCSSFLFKLIHGCVHIYAVLWPIASYLRTCACFYGVMSSRLFFLFVLTFFCVAWSWLQHQGSIKRWSWPQRRNRSWRWLARDISECVWPCPSDPLWHQEVSWQAFKIHDWFGQEDCT